MFWIAFTLGLMGSLHCIGMCGPIALAIPLSSQTFSGRLTGALLYNSGRIITYSVFGIVFGMLGNAIKFAGFQQTTSIILGTVILLYLIFPNQFFGTNIIAKKSYALISSIKNQFSTLFKKKGYTSAFIIGLLNGLLPCGLVYMAIAGSVATSNPVNGSLFMAFFGLGTLPVMLSLLLARNLISNSFRLKINKAVPLFVGFMAILLIIRGLDLGIPYLSPQIDSEQNCVQHCCSK